MRFYGKAEAVATRIIEAFESGNVPKALAPIFIKKAGRHASSYSWANQLLIALAGWSDAMGYGSKDGSTGWLSVGRQVRKGERATYILAPCTSVVDDPKAETGKRTVIRGFRALPVFGIEQTDIIDNEKWGKCSKNIERTDAWLADLPLREVADSWGLSVQAYNGQEHKALGKYRYGESIALGVKNLSTWAHELVHAADDKAGKLVERGQHWRSETVAELGGAVLMMVMGYDVDADLGGAWEYICNYVSAAKIEPIKACMDVLKRTCEAVAMILEAAEKVNSSIASKLVAT